MSTFLSFPGMKMMRLGTRIFMKKFRGQRFALHPGMNMNHQGTRIFTERSVGSTLCPPPGDENHAPVLHFHENSVGLIPRCSLLTSSCQRNHSVMSISSPGT